MKRVSNKVIAIIGSVATVLGLVGAVASFSFTPQPTHAEANEPVAPISQPKATETNVKIEITGHPVHITAASVGIDLPVVDGIYNAKNGQWTLNPDKAQFATPSKEPNNTSGTTYIYGHDTRAVFNRLHKLVAGAEVSVTTSNGYRFVYVFKDSVITTPYAVAEVTAPSATPRLSLQTCYGPTSADRRIFHFDLARVEKL